MTYCTGITKKILKLAIPLFFILFFLPGPLALAASDLPVNGIIEEDTTIRNTSKTLTRGGYIVKRGTLEFTGTTLTLNRNISGDPVFTVQNGAVLRLSGKSKFDLSNLGNKTAVKVEAGGTLIIDDSEVSGANGAAAGSFVFVSGGTLEIVNGAVVRNNTNSSEDGNIIRIDSGKLTITNAEVSGNTANTGLNKPRKGVIAVNETEIRITGSVFSNNSDQYVGLLFIVDSDPVLIDSSVFRNNQSLNGYNTDLRNNQRSGVISASGSSIFIADDNEFSENKTSFYSSVLTLENSSLEIRDDNRFTYNTSGDTGGAVYAENTPISVGERNEFSHNEAGMLGGAIYTRGPSLTIGDNNIFSYNHSDSAGGALNVNGDTVVIGSNNLFEGNSAGTPGGAIITDAVKLNIGAGCRFIDNSSSNYGGAIADFCSNTDHEIVIGENVVFSGNNSGNEGGAIYMQRSLKLSNNVRFSDNTSKRSGGAVKQVYGSMEVTGAVFQNNSSGGDGGAILAESLLNVVIKDSVFIGNRSAKNGAAVNLTEGNSGSYVKWPTELTISGSCEFSDNQSYDMGNGGAICGYYDEVNIEGDVRFLRNSASFGGAIFMTVGTLNVGDGVVFSENEVGGCGGAIASEEGTEVTVGKVSFTGNGRGNLGGAIFQNRGKLTINGAEFRENRSVFSGGAIYAFAGELDTPEGMILRISDALFEKNISYEGGGAIAVQGFDGPGATGARAEDSTVFYLDSAVFRENQCRYGGAALNVEKAASVYIKKAAIVNNEVIGIRNVSGSPGKGLFMFPRNGAAVFDNRSGIAPAGFSDAYTRIEGFETAQKMLNGGLHHWKSDDSGQYFGTEPSDKDISGALVLMENNSHRSEWEESPSSSVIYNVGTVYIGEPGTDLKIEVRWEYPDGYSEEPPAAGDYLPFIGFVKGGEPFDPGTPVLISHTREEDGSDVYTFRGADDVYTEYTLVDKHDGVYAVTAADLPESADYRIAAMALPKYESEVSGDQSAGFLIVNRFREDAIPTPTPLPTETPLPMPTREPEPTSDGMEFFLLPEDLEVLPKTGF